LRCLLLEKYKKSEYFNAFEHLMPILSIFGMLILKWQLKIFIVGAALESFVVLAFFVVFAD
jgi:hypothetical protein